MRTLWVMAVLTTCCACELFTGERNQAFQSNLTRSASMWTPKTPIAPGTTLIVSPVFGATGVHLALDVVIDGGSVTVSSTQGESVSLLAGAPGRAHVEWNTRAAAAVYDSFPVTVEVPVSVEADEPITHSTEVDDGRINQYFHGVHSVSTISPIAIVPGEPYYLEMVLRGADGGWVAHSPGVIALSRSDREHVFEDGFGVVVAIDGGATSFTLSAGAVTRTYDVEPHALTEAVSLQLSLGQPEGSPSPAYVIAVATPYLDGGAPLHQAPIAFSTSNNLIVLDWNKQFNQTYRRRDVQVFLLSDDGGVPLDGGLMRHHVSVTARANGFSVTKETDLDLLAPDVTPVDGGPGFPGIGYRGCGCNPSSSGALPMMLLWGVGALWVRRRTL